MDREQIEGYWEDISNWKWGVIYSCPEDPRVIVPRRWKWGGWTINSCHPRAGIAILTAIAIAVGPTLITLFLFKNLTAAFVVMLLSIVALIVWSHKESCRTS